jgi:predicted ArsR family transcriptional regulator
MLSKQWPRPIQRNANTYAHHCPIHIAAATTPNVCRRHATTVTALREFEMRRNDARTAGTGMPDCCSRSVGKTSGSSEASGSMVVAMIGVLHFSDR